MQLSSHFHAAVHDGDLVLLDERAGSYACLPGAGEVVRLTGDASILEVADPALRQDLLQLGVLTSESAASPRARVRPAGADLFDQLAPPARAVAAARMAGAWLAVRGAYRRAAFDDLVAWGRGAALGGCGPAAEIAAASLEFRGLLAWTPRLGPCLYRSMLLLGYLRARGLSASWVFGVQTWPFEAHCWLQAGEVVLDDHLEHVCGFTPILVLAP